MIETTSFEVQRYDFKQGISEDFHNNHFAKSLWPVVYIISDGKVKEAYVGETTDTYARMAAHLKNNEKNRLTAVHLITSEKFNKSATLDIESNLIRYLSGDGQFRLLNANVGIANHNYYQKKELYWHLFQSIWDRLRTEGIAKQSLEVIDNSDLFKYSPYKALTADQKSSLMALMVGLLDNKMKTILVNGGAGTGKTILAIFLFKLINGQGIDFNFKEFGEEESDFVNVVLKLKERYPSPKMGLVVPMSSFRNTLKKVFKNIKGLTADMVIGPAEIAKDEYDILVVDESHRLRRRINLGSYYGKFDEVCKQFKLVPNDTDELEWIQIRSNKAILFYDQSQSIKPSDVKRERFEELLERKDSIVQHLKSQLRVKGGDDYVDFVNKLLNCDFKEVDTVFKSKEYEFVMFSSLDEMVHEIKSRETEEGLSRIIAGYSWPWISKEDKTKFDIKIGDTSLRWNSVANDWINSPDSLNEVGCIHTTQGYDLNYSGIIFGNEISYDPEKKEIVVLKENYYDRNGKQSITDPSVLRSFILNIYKTILLRGIKGTYVYVCDDSLREYFAKHIPLFKQKSVGREVKKIEIVPFVNSVPLYDLRAAAGGFSEEQLVAEDYSDIKWIEVPDFVKPSKDMFACTVVGQSMNRVIPNGSICLFRRYSGGSRNGKIVLVRHRNIQDVDFGSGYTVKEYHSQKLINDDSWEHLTIRLRPLSYDDGYNEIVLAADEISELQVIGVFERVIA